MAISKSPEPVHFEPFTNYNLKPYKLIRQRKSTKGNNRTGVPSLNHPRL